MEFDISTLVDETFNHFNQINSDILKNEDDIAIAKQEKILVPSSPGVVFTLSQSDSTYIVRVLDTRCLSETFEDITQFPENYPSLRLNLDDNIKSNLLFFECIDIKIAKTIKKALHAKRFSKNEEFILNISDPSDSCWLAKSEDSLKIFFNLSKTNESDSVINLGPIFSAYDYQDKLNKLYGYFKMLFDMKSFSLTQNTIEMIPVNNSDLVFNDFRNLFYNANLGQNIRSKMLELEQKSKDESYYKDLVDANNWLYELSILGSFWKNVQLKLN
ncbi:MAG: hypothetical protein N4A33_10585 [Bacteriovoracaceae bacterium]|jgi:hypothetical protein|nr:hypothetical protein [Bacteriovoracaceae bacterium]